MKLCICFAICLSSKWFCLRLTFFSFLKPWAANGSTNQYSCQLFYGQGGEWHVLCHPISKLPIVEGPGETPSALRWMGILLSCYLSFKMDSRMGIFSSLLSSFPQCSEGYKIQISPPGSTEPRKIWSMDGPASLHLFKHSVVCPLWAALFSVYSIMTAVR